MCKRRERLESELAIDEYIEVVVVLITKRNCKTGFGGEQKSIKEPVKGQSVVSGIEPEIRSSRNVNQKTCFPQK